MGSSVLGSTVERFRVKIQGQSSVKDVVPSTWNVELVTLLSSGSRLARPPTIMPNTKILAPKYK
jgi:hypothetical protein